MKKFSKVALSTLAVCGAGLLAIYSCNADTDPQTAQLQLIIEEGGLTIGIDDQDLYLGTGTSSFTEQTKSATFEENFWVEDLKGAASGYYTTVQSSDLKGTIEGKEYSIGSGNIKFTANDKTTITGAANDDVKAELTSAALNSAQTYFQRGTDTTPTTAGILGKYGTKPTITVTVPANTPATTYTGTLTYTLIDRAPSLKTPK